MEEIHPFTQYSCCRLYERRGSGRRCRSPDAIAQLGRACAVVAGGIAVFASFLLAREVLPRLPALAASAAMAVAPLMTVHARYFKEDIFLLPFLLVALVLLIKSLRTPTVTRGILLGAAIGFASAAKYVGWIILPFSIGFLVLAPCFQDRGDRVKFIALVVLVACIAFLLIELPVFWEFAQFRRAVHFELSHAAHGHDVRLPISITYGIFHLRESLLPGLGWPLLVLGLLGLTTPIWAAPARRAGLLVIASFALLWYAAHELSPLKPFPGFHRYVLPLAPLLIILAASFIYELADRYVSRGSDFVTVIIVVLATIPALRLSLLINGPSADDLRSALPPLLSKLQPTPFFDRNTNFVGLGATANPTNLFVTSSLRYERYIRFGSEPRQSSVTSVRADYYNALFQFPYLEITNGRPSFAFFNPVVRVVATDGSVVHLNATAKALSSSSSGMLTIRLVNGDQKAGSRQLTCPYRPRRRLLSP